MERAAKLLVTLTICLAVLASDVEGGRRIKGDKEKVDYPQNFFGSFGGTGGIVSTPFGPAVALGPSGFCSFPGIGCVRVQPTNPGGVIGSPHAP